MGLRFDPWSSGGRNEASPRLYETSNNTQRDLRRKVVPEREIGVCPHPGLPVNVYYLPRPEIDGLIEREFGEDGRDPGFLPGWWILPAWVLGLPLVIWLASLLT